MLTFNLLMYVAAIASMVMFVLSAVAAERARENPQFAYLIGFVVLLLGAIFLSKGFFTLQPNQASVLTLFGNYVGTVRDDGFHWTNPFNSKRQISLRIRNFNSDPLKVNDKRGNPIEIGAVVVWRVSRTSQAIFDVQDCEEFVEVQSESALRHLANSYAYDNGEEGEETLRSDVAEVSHALLAELQERLSQAGVVVEEARLSHLAYAPEIASAMLRRQQAEAIITARTKIVEGAVSMVEMALHNLAASNIVDLDEERKAAMVTNLLVVLCSESDTHPVINAGTLYT
ncbi:MAG: SPFH domain-containing protein [Planctomycetales bacterium]|nr:SPFH domain-containing protein [Planctomycetales bacterium]